jgi:DNA primase catalytic core
VRFTSDFLEELRTRLPVSTVVGERVKLKRAGRELKGLSPFVQEKTPSFFVNDQKGYWFDFACGKNGSIFDFIMLLDGCSFPEAVERLAQRAGLALPASSPEAEEASARRGVLRDLHEAAAIFYRNSLTKVSGSVARKYLEDREIGADVAEKFGIGYAGGDRDALKVHLVGEGHDLEDMIEAGLIAQPEEGPLHDRFTRRVIFPIKDIRGRVIAFAGRALADDQVPKYLNSPESPTFHKGRVVYNAEGARRAAYAGAPTIIVEGYMDVIAMVSAGFEATCATMGTAITAEQLAIIWKWAEDPIICLDGDDAGTRAAAKVAELALPLVGPGRSLRFVRLPAGVDPDKLIREEGREAMESLLEHAEPLSAMIWRVETASGDFDTPEKRAGLEARLRELLRSIKDSSVRKHYGQEYKAALHHLWSGKPVTIGAKRPSRFGRVSWSEQDALTTSNYEWLIKGILPARETTALTGASGSGKTFEAFNMCMHIAMGWDYRGRRTKQGLVIYCAPEGGVGAVDRMRAYRRHYNIALEGVPFEMLPRQFNIFANEKDVTDLVEEIHAISGEWESRGINLMLVVIDTWSAATAGIKENTGEDVGVVRSRIKRIQDQCETGVMFVHHLNAGGERSRGHSSIIADIDTELRVQKLMDSKDVEIRDDDGTKIRRLMVQKQREGRDGDHWDFVLRNVNVRLDEDGEQVTSAVTVEPARANAGAVEEQSRGRRRVDGVNLNNKEALFFRSLLSALEGDNSVPTPAAMRLPSSITRVVSWSHVSIEYRRKVPSETGETKDQYRSRIKSAMRYSREKLLSYGVIGLDQTSPDGADGADGAPVHVLWVTGKRVVGPDLVWPPALRAVAAAACDTQQPDMLGPVSDMDRETPF